VGNVDVGMLLAAASTPQCPAVADGHALLPIRAQRLVASVDGASRSRVAAMADDGWQADIDLCIE
jgi:hypothetical protein